MNKAFELILDRLQIAYDEHGDTAEHYKEYVEKIVKEVSEEYNNGWIPCDVKMPPVETEVFVVAKRKYRGGEVKYINTTAIYEDGTVLENDSCWRWEDIEGEWDEE